jgi:hypothetical protein
MIIDSVDNYKNGWLVGHFEPKLIQSSEIEVGYQKFTPYSITEDHYHLIGTEYNLITRGKMIVNGKELCAGQIFILEPKEVSRVKFLEETEILIIKTPAAKVYDKYVVQKELL